MIPIALGIFSMVLVSSIFETRKIKETAEEEVSICGWRLQVLQVWRVLVITCILGLLFAIADDASTAALWARIPLGICLVVTLGAVAILSPVGWGSHELGRSLQAQGSSLLKRLIKVGAALAAFAVAFALGGYLDKDADSRSPTVVAKYHVEGTDTNGSGFLNLCEEPAPCAGENPVGRLSEGDPVLIDCQLKGKQVESKSGDVSYIWDRLGSEGFVSDLFVSTSGAGRFSRGIPRCVPWDWE